MYRYLNILCTREIVKQNKRKVDADFQAAWDEQNWYNPDSNLRKFPDVYSLIYNFSPVC